MDSLFRFYIHSMSTPVMQQHREFKKQYPDCILFFRIGDFFELFGDDAVDVHRILGLTLTKRNNGAAGQIPLAGFPHHQLDRYIPKLTAAGKKVAICDQIEDPKEAKGIVARDVIEVITPGTSFNEASLEVKGDHLLGALTSAPTGRFALALLEATTGDFSVTEGDVDEVTTELFRRLPKELLIVEAEEGEPYPEPIRRLLEQERCLLTPLPSLRFSPETATELLKKQFGTTTLEPFGLEDRPDARGAAGAVLGYLLDLKRAPMEHIDRIVWRQLDDYMVLDPQTLRNLEILRPLNHEDEKATLVHVLDHTRTAMGGRMLRRWLSHPLLRKEPLEERLEAVAELVEEPLVSDRLREVLSDIYDLERLTGRIGSGRANGRDLKSLGEGLIQAAALGGLLADRSAARLRTLVVDNDDLLRRGRRITNTLLDELPLTVTEGGLIRPGADPDLDALNEGIRDARTWLSSLESRERGRTGIGTLKIGFNKVFGYYIEVSNTHREKVPEDYIRKQTLVNAERYITPEMKEMEARILHAEEEINSLEHKIFSALRTEAAGWSPFLRNLSEAIGEIDTLYSFSVAARKYHFQRPELRTDRLLRIEEGFHPVIVANNPGENFIRNSLTLDGVTRQILLITGPNMAGKSTYLRQTGLIVLMAQVGSFVPADAAEIGLTDRIFTRVGASDRLARGQSTFMVEMVETANILHHATPNSLILLDEIGRGTGTFDGLSLAWSIVETLHEDPDRAGKVLFATHYHEITALEESLSRLVNVRVTVQEKNGELLFLRKVVEGAGDSSYGIQVARMAGLPKPTIARAQKILRRLEQQRLHPLETEREQIARKIDGVQESLFSATPLSEGEALALEELKKIDPERMTPLEALQFLADLTEHYLD